MDAATILAEVDRLGGTLVIRADGSPALRAPNDPAKRRALADLAPLLTEFREQLLSSLPGPTADPEPEPVECRECAALWWCEAGEIRMLCQSPAWCSTPGCPWRGKR